MNSYLKEFLHRGMMFSGLGPIVLGIIYALICRTDPNTALAGHQILVGIVSTFLIAFVQAGTTVFYQIEHWSTPKAVLCHFSLLYIIYSVSYVMNTWIPFDVRVILIFTAIFAAVYFLIWITVYICIKTTSKKLNSQLK